MSQQRKPVRRENRGGYEVRVVGAPPVPLRDFYHTVLRLSWTRTMLLVAAGYLVINAIFALLFFVVGGIANARPGSLADDFFFSVQTMGTIGYGAMYPSSLGAEWLVVMESTVSLVITALATGLIFAKFSRPNARLMFSREATIAPMNGVPTLSFRISNQRANRIAEAHIRLVLVRTERTDEGKTFYRMIDLGLTREYVPSLSRSWTVLHPIDASSPFWGQTPASLHEQEVEVMVSVSGTDDIWMQNIHATYRYFDWEILWGKRHVDILSAESEPLILDLRKFHDVESTKPSTAFPYPEET